MNTREQVEMGLKDAMRARDEVKKRTLRMVLSAIRLADVDSGRPLQEPEVIAILQKEVKSRQEAIEEAQRAQRPELQAEAEAEIAVIQKYLPEPLSEQELKAMAQQAIAEAGATSMREMGQVMKLLVPRLEGRATGQQASQMVRSLLQS